MDPVSLGLTFALSPFPSVRRFALGHVLHRYVGQLRLNFGPLVRLSQSSFELNFRILKQSYFSLVPTPFFQISSRR